MKLLPAAIVMIFLSFAALAQDAPEIPSFPTLSEQEVMDLAGKMFNAYRIDRAAGMFKTEKSCWASLSKRKKPVRDDLPARCSVLLFSGAIIEAAYARQGGRGPMPPYDTKGSIARVTSSMTGSGYSELEAAATAKNLVDLYMDQIIGGLSMAGMR